MSTLKTTNIAHPSSASNNIVLDSSGNVNLDSGTLYVDASNNRVGIGTTSPGRTLHVDSGAVNNSYIRFSNTNSTGNGAEVGLYDDGSAGPSLILNNSMSDGVIVLNTNSTERARIDSSGRLLVGTSSAPNLNTVAAPRYPKSIIYNVASNDDRATLALYTGNTGTTGPLLSLVKNKAASTTSTLVASDDEAGNINFGACDGSGVVNVASIKAEVDGTPGANDMPGRLVFSTTADGASGPTERMRLDSTGSIYVNTTTTPSTTSFGTVIFGGNSLGYIGSFRNTTSTGVCANFGGNLGQVRVMGDGDLENTNNRYTGISDIKFKQNIEDANSQWDDIKGIRVRKYEFIANPDRKHIGLVAQELEEVCPGLVIERIHNEETGETAKSVAYSVLYMKAVKALQEAMERIETLEAKVAALEAS